MLINRREMVYKTDERRMLEGCFSQQTVFKLLFIMFFVSFCENKSEEAERRQGMQKR